MRFCTVSAVRDGGVVCRLGNLSGKKKKISNTSRVMYAVPVLLILFMDVWICLRCGVSFSRFCLYDVHHVVSDFLTLCDEIIEECAEVIAVLA